MAVSSQEANAQTVHLSTSATNGTNLDSIPFNVVFNDPAHQLQHSHIAVERGTARQDSTASTPISKMSFYIGAFNERGIGILGSGDGQFYYPRAIAVNSTGHIYVADSNNNRIQIFDLAGNYVSQFGIGAPHGMVMNDTHIHITDTANHRIQIFDNSGNYISQFGSGPGNGNGTFNSPQAIAMNSTRILVVDAENYRIQVFDHSGNYVSQFGQLGTGDHQFLRPSAIALNSTHNIFVADFLSDKIKIFNQTGHYMDSFGTGIDGPSAVFEYNDFIYVASQNNGKIIKFDQNSTGTYVDVGLGDDMRLQGILDNRKNHVAPSAIFIDESTDIVYAADGQRHQVFVDRKVWSFNVNQGTGEIKVWINTNNPTGADSNRIYLTIDKTGPIPTISSSIQEATSTKPIPFNVEFNEPMTGFEASDIVASSGTVQNFRSPIEYYDTGRTHPTDFIKGQIAVNATGYIYTTNPSWGVVEVYDPYGNHVLDFNHPIVTGLKTGFNDPQGIAINGTGYIYVTDTAHSSVHIFDPSNKHVSYFGTHGTTGSSSLGDFSRPIAIDINATGHVFVADAWNHRVQIFDPSGKYLDHIGGDGPGSGGKGTGDGQFDRTADVAVNSTGYIYVLDDRNDRVQIFDPSGNYVGKFDSAGDSSFDILRSIAIDSDDNVYVTDIGNLVSPETRNIIPDPTCEPGIPPGGTLADHIICTVRTAYENAGIHKFGPSGNYLGDLDIVGQDKIAVPSGIYFDDTDDIYVTDGGNNQIYIERDGFTFEVVNAPNGHLEITIPANSVHDAAGNGNTASTHTVNVAITPEPPTSLIAEPRNESVQLSWTAPANTYGTPITDYIIERNNGNSWITVSDGVSTDTVTTVTGLTNGVTYQFRVHAVNSIGTSLLSNVASATPNAAPTSPGIPTDLAATAGNTQVVLSWTAPDPNRSPLTDYTIQYKLTTANSWTTFNDGTVNQTSTTVTGITNGVPYQFRVSATNGIGTGLASTPLDFTIPSTIDTVAPSVVLSTVSSSPTSLSSIPFSITFSENVTGFEASDITVSSGTVTKLVGSFTGFFGELGSRDGQFNTPKSIAVNSTGHIFVLENHNSRIQILEIIDGEIRHAANFDITQFNDPQRMAMNSTGHIFVTDEGSDGVHVIEPSGKYLTTLGSTRGSGDDQFDNPVGITINGTDHIFVVDTFNERVKILDSSGKYLDQIDDNSTGDGRLGSASDIAINSTGHIFVTDPGFERVQIFNALGHYVGTFGSQGSGDGQFNDPLGITINSEDQIYVVDQRNSRVQIFDSAGNYQSEFNGPGSGDDTLRWPTDIVLDSMGGIYVTSLTSYQIYVERDTHSFEVQNPVNGRLAVSIPAGSVHDAAGNGNTASNTVSLTVTGSSTVLPTVTAPGAPTGLTATVTSNTAVTLSWTAPTNIGGSAIASYTIQQSIDAGTTWTASTPSTSTGTTVTVTGLTNDTPYSFRVNATNTQGTGAASDVVIATPTASAQQSTAPGAPTNLLTTVGDGTVSLSWTAPTNTGNSAIIRYNIEQSTDGTTWTASTPATATGLTQTVTGLTNGQEYQFRVSATNDQLTGGWSATVSATPATVPDAPMYPSFWLTDDATEVRIFWDVPASDGGSAITNYKPQYKIVSSPTWIDGPTGLAIPATVSGLTPNQHYEFRVFAENDIGRSDASQITSIILVPRQATSAPGAPTNLSAVAGNGIVTLSWTAPSTGGSATGYKVQQSTDGSTWTASAFTVSGNTATVTGLTNDVQYSFRVLATNSAGDSVVSNVDTATPRTQQTTTVPGAPTYPSFWLTDDATEVRLYWDAPADNGGSAITGYKTQYKIVSSPTWIDGETVTSVPATISNLTPGQHYEFRVFAVNVEGDSKASPVTSGTLTPR